MNKTLGLFAFAILLPAAAIAAKIQLNALESKKIHSAILQGAVTENEEEHFQVFSARLEGKDLQCVRVYSTERGVKIKCTMLALDRKGYRRFKLDKTLAQILFKTLEENPRVQKFHNAETKSTSITVSSFKCDKDAKSKKFAINCDLNPNGSL